MKRAGAEADEGFTRALALVLEARDLRQQGVRQGPRGRLVLDQAADLRSREAVALIVRLGA